MRSFKALRGVMVCSCVTVGLLAVLAGSAIASGVKVCVPEKEDKPIVTPVGGVCKAGYTVNELGGEGGGATPAKKAKPPALSEAEVLLLKSILPYVRFVAAGVGGKPTIQVDAANLQILSGSGSTAGAVNGAGNLVIGYDARAEIEGEPTEQTGSNNLIVGTEQTYNSYGSIIAGSHDLSTAPWTDVFGHQNNVEGPNDSVTGGQFGATIGQASSISGGMDNLALIEGSSVTGGFNNRVATNPFGSVTGGIDNEASGLDSWIGGGEFDKAKANNSSILGVGNKETKVAKEVLF
jgi:hypothetical protein